MARGMLQARRAVQQSRADGFLVVEQLAAGERALQVAAALRRMPTAMREVVSRRYGIAGPEQTDDDIAKAIGATVPQVQKLEAEAFRWIMMRTKLLAHIEDEWR